MSRVIVIGSGHNGLVCAAYLARGGCSVTVVEAQSHVGGMAATVEAMGVMINLCSCDHLLIRSTPISAELELDRFGLHYLNVDPPFEFVPWAPRNAWMLHRDIDATIAAIGLAYPREVSGYRSYVRELRPLASLLLELAHHRPWSAPFLRVLTGENAIRRLPALRRLARASLVDVLRRFFTNDELITPGCILGASVGGVAPNVPGTGLGALSYVLRHLVPTGRPAGGSGRLATALIRSLRVAGGVVETSRPVDAVTATKACVTGVVLATGESLSADIVVVACDPRRLALIDLPRRNRRQILPALERDEIDGCFSKIDAVLHLPPDLPLGWTTTVMLPQLAAFVAAEKSVREKATSILPPMLAHIPSVGDDALRPERGELLSLEVLWTPYGAPHDPARWLEFLGHRFAWDALGAVERSELTTPEVYEARFGMPRGAILGFSPKFLGSVARRHRALSRYAGSIRGLYFTGAATYPGSGIWGASGRNTATTILAGAG